jgi:polysaccharide export outer membrane protein
MLRRSLLVFIAAGLTVGCAHNARLPEGFVPDRAVPYRLATGDRLRIIVFGQDNLSNSYAIDASGRISMPLIGLVQAGGITTPELERRIEAHLRNGYLREPRVAVEVEVYRPFFVLGEVTTSGQFPYVSGITAQTAVAIAGGFTPRALRTQVELTRTVDGQPVTAMVPIAMPILPGDTVVVRERWF